MPELQLLDTEYAQLFYDQENRIIHHHITPAMQSHQWQELLSKGYQTLKTNGAKKWLSDNRGLQHPIEDEHNAWIFGVWLPQMMAAGWSAWAIVVPDEVAFRAVMIDFINEFYEKGLRIMVFSKLEDGMAWLKSVN